MTEIAKVRIKMQACRDEITRFDVMTKCNAEFVPCMIQFRRIIMAHLDIMDETLNYDDEILGYENKEEE